MLGADEKGYALPKPLNVGEVIFLDDFIYNCDLCRTTSNNDPLYRYAWHLTKSLGQTMDLMRVVLKAYCPTKCTAG